MAVFSNDDDRKSFRLLLKITETFREVDKDILLSSASVFLWVALHEGSTQREMRDDLGLASSTSSRNLAALSKVHRLGKPGLGLVEWVESPEDRRAKLLFLTTKGKALVGQLLAALD